jgi:hypothetical protein
MRCFFCVEASKLFLFFLRTDIAQLKSKKLRHFRFKLFHYALIKKRRAIVHSVQLVYSVVPPSKFLTSESCDTNAASSVLESSTLYTVEDYPSSQKISLLESPVVQLQSQYTALLEITDRTYNRILFTISLLMQSFLSSTPQRNIQ